MSSSPQTGERLWIDVGPSRISMGAYYLFLVNILIEIYDIIFIESAISKNRPKTSNPLLPSFVSLCIQRTLRGSSHGLEDHWEKSSHIELKHPVIFNRPGVAKQIMTHSTLKYTTHYNTQHITIHRTLQ